MSFDDVMRSRSATLQGGWRRRDRFMVWRSRRVGPKVRVTASVKLLPVPSARILCFINVHQHNKRCREVGFWVFAERRCWSRTTEPKCFCEFLLYVPGVAFLRRCAKELGPCRSEVSSDLSMWLRLRARSCSFTGSSLERVLSSCIQTGILISLSLSRASLSAAAQRLGLAAAAGGYR